MLVLTRRVGEEIVITVPGAKLTVPFNSERIEGAEPDIEIRVKLLEIRGDQIRFGVSAPDDVTIDRHEIHAAKQQGDG